MIQHPRYLLPNAGGTGYYRFALDTGSWDRLVRALPAAWDMPSSKAHIVRWPAALIGDPRVKKFVDWVTAEADATTRRRS